MARESKVSEQGVYGWLLLAGILHYSVSPVYCYL